MVSPRGKLRDGVKTTVGLIVEGDTEFRALPRLHSQSLVAGCPPLKAVNLGGVGSDRTPVGIAKLVAPKVIEHQIAGRSKVVVCMDREQRARCAAGFAADVRGALVAELASRGRLAGDVHVVISDRTFEAWLLAGAKELYAKGKLKRSPTSGSFEGRMGARGRKGVHELSTLLGRPYSKVRDGLALFDALDFAAARRHGRGGRGSKSLDKFLRTLGI